MNVLLYDVKRALRNPSVLALAILTTLLAVALLGLILSHARSAYTNPPPTPAQLQEEASLLGIDIIGGIFGFFVPVLGLVLGNSLYARERSTGILDSVLCRPVTRGELVVSRFAALAIAAAAILALSLGLTDLVALVVTGFPIAAVPLLAVYLALLVEVLSFGGLVMLISHLFRSTSAIQGISTTFFVLFSIVWYFALILIAVVQGQANALQTIFVADYFSPAQYGILATALVQNTFLFGLLPLNSGSIGIGVGAIVAGGCLWSLGPVGATYYLATRRD